MKVFVLGRSLPGANTSVGQFEFEQALALSKQPGFKVSYLFFDDRSVLYNRKIGWTRQHREGIDCIGRALPTGGLPWGIFCAIKTKCLEQIFNEAVKTYGYPDVVHVHFPAMCMTTSFAAMLKRSSIPFVCTEHWSRVMDGTIDSNRCNALIEIAKDCSSFICVSQDLKDSVQRITGVDRNKLYVIPNLVFENRFNVETTAQRLDEGDGVKRYFSAGRLEKGKRFDVLLEAFSRLPRNRRRALIIAGDGSQANSLKSLARRLGVDDIVRFIGWQKRDAIASLYAETNCYISASPKETFGVPFAEAWMCGTPCIGTDNNPLREHFNGKWGRTFCANEPESLAECILLYESEDPDYSAHDISTWANALFSATVVGKRLSEILSEACSTRC